MIQSRAGRVESECSRDDAVQGGFGAGRGAGRHALLGGRMATSGGRLRMLLEVRNCERAGEVQE